MRKLHIPGWYLFLLLLIQPSGVSAQAKQDDVVYLNNGTFLRGKLDLLVPGISLRIIISGKDTINIPMSDVKEIRKENAPERLHYEDGVKAWGYTNITDIAFGFGLSESIVTGVDQAQEQRLIGLSTFNGATITPYIQLGLGTGLEFWQNRGFLPFYIDLRANILKKVDSPFGYVHAGYAAGWMTGEQGMGLGGAMAAVGAGARFGISRLKVVVSLGYRFQQARQWQTLNQVNSKATIDAHFMVLKTGVFF